MSQNSPLRSAEQNGTDFLLKMRFDRTAKSNNNRKTFYRSKAPCFGMSFQKFFLLLSGSERNYSVFSLLQSVRQRIQSIFIFRGMVGTKLRSSACFLFSEMVRNGILSLFVYCGMARNNSVRFRSAKQ